MTTGQILFGLFLLGVIGLAVYRGVLEPFMEKRRNGVKAAKLKA